MKFCTNCGARLDSEKAKFCPDCGEQLFVIPKPKEKQQEKTEDEVQASIFELGNKLEDVVEKIYRSKGYATERRQRLLGESGTKSEIDILAKRGNRILAIECKNYSFPVGIDKVRDFNQKIHDVGLAQGVFIAYSGLTEGALRSSIKHKLPSSNKNRVNKQ
jgi:predicted  nucleic acid-binding Zn-ribbon protein